MENGNLVFISSPEKGDHLRSERDFRHHNNYVPAVFKNIVNKLQKNRGFSAARYAVKQRDAPAAAIFVQKSAIGFFLHGRKADFCAAFIAGKAGFRYTVNVNIGNAYKALVFQRPDNRCGNARDFAKLLDFCAACVRKHTQNLRLLQSQLFECIFKFNTGNIQHSRFCKKLANLLARFNILLNKAFFRQPFKHIAAARKLTGGKNCFLCQEAYL